MPVIFDDNWSDYRIGKEDIMKEPRYEVYRAINSERNYQDAQLGNAKRREGQPPMSPGEIILCMEECLMKARETWYRPDGGEKCLDDIRKVTALGVLCMERYGAPHRTVNKENQNDNTGRFETTPVYGEPAYDTIVLANEVASIKHTLCSLLRDIQQTSTTGLPRRVAARLLKELEDQD